MIHTLVANPSAMAAPRTIRPFEVTASLPSQQDSVEIACEVENPGRVGFGVLSLKKQLSLGSIDLPPLQKANLPPSHPAVVCERS